MAKKAKDESQFDEWALLELFGHNRLAGRVRNASIGGGSFIRVDIPRVKGPASLPEQQPLTKFISPSAVYAITPMTEETVMAMYRTGLRVEPIARYDIRAMLPALKAGEDEPYEER